MKAAVIYKANSPLIIEDVDIEDPRAGEVQVRITAKGLCHSDLHNIKGEWEPAFPAILGHEGTGIVEAVGNGVRNVRVGDRVILSFRPNCGRCANCVRGVPVICDGSGGSRKLMMDGTSRVSVRGQALFVSARLGTFAERIVCPEEQAIPITQTIPEEVAAVIACCVTTGVCAVTNAAQVQPGDRVAVIGCGGVGLSAIQGARLVGAGQIVAIDVVDLKLDYAKQFGATHTLNASRVDAVREVRELSQGGVDYAIEAIGLSATIEQAVDCLRPGGKAVVVGMTAMGQRAGVDAHKLVAQQKTLMGTSYGNARQRVDIPRIVDLYLSGKLDLDRLISHRYRLEQINDGFARLEQGEAARGVVVFS
jgi:S-(hydroxymethyl)glutathione dehydrogenase/alcohol dehydrogenase